MIRGLGEASPTDSPGETGAIEPFAVVFGNAGEQDLRFPGCDGCFESLKLFDDGVQSFRSLGLLLWREPLPIEEESEVILNADWQNLRAQPIDSATMNSSED